jgi:hypothetical protein
VKIICIVRRLTLAASTLFVCAALSSTAFADTGALRVNISDAEGNPVVGAVVTASSPDSLLSKSGVTNEDGDVRLAGLDPADNYAVTVSAEGYTPARNVDAARKWDSWSTPGRHCSLLT